MNLCIALFAFNRPHLLEKLLNRLSLDPLVYQLPIILFIDGPRDSVDEELVTASETVAKNYTFINEVYIEPMNKGLKSQIISKISLLFESYAHVIVLEDDLIPSLGFIDFHLTYSPLVSLHSGIYQVSGHMFDFPWYNSSSPLLLPVSTSWGWSTSRCVWNSFVTSIEALPSLSNLDVFRYNLYGAYGFSYLYNASVKGIISSWAILFYTFVFSNHAFVIHPPKSLVCNSGFSATNKATHGSLLMSITSKFFHTEKTSLSYNNPVPIKNNLLTFSYFFSIFCSTLRPISFFRNLLKQSSFRIASPP